MEKRKKVTSKYVARELAKKDLTVFRPRDVAVIQKSDKQSAYQKLREMIKAGFAERVRNGLYVLIDLKGETPDPFVVASKAVNSSYISYLTALNYYGLSDQVPRVIQMATTVRTTPFTYGGMKVKYHLLQPTKFYGYTTVRTNDSEALIAFPEKALIDSLDNPSLAGGPQEVIETLINNVPNIDTQRMKELLERFPSKSTVSRIGFILGRSGEKTNALKQRGTDTPIPLLPGKKKFKLHDKDWNILYEKEMISRLQEDR